MMTRLPIYYLFITGLLFFVSCKKESLKAPKASFLVAYPSVLATSAQGSNTHKITDMWLYVDEQFQGCFEAGKVMPIVASGSANIKLFAGIKNNGISGTRQPYFFYKPVDFTQTIEAGKTYTVNPVFEYLSTTQVKFADDFDSGASHFQPSGDSSYNITSANAFENTGKSVFMSMSDAKPTAKMITSSFFTVPIYGAAVYLEMDYQCNQEITVGIVSGTEERQAITLNATTGWNKIYIDLRTVINALPASPYCKFYIAASKQVSTPLIYIDNVKVITE